MPPAQAKNMLDRVLDIIFGKKLEGEDADRARVAGPPQWMRTAYLFLHTGSILVALVLLIWSWGWIPFNDSPIDSIWGLAALGVGALLGWGWERITQRYEREAKAGRATKAAFLE